MNTHTQYSQLVNKYAIQAPRYTSYPTALHFAEIDDSADPVTFICSHNTIPRPVSLYIHIPFCASLCWFCGCTKVITRRQGDSKAYLKRLFSELESLRRYLHRESKIVQLHFGGGTPTFLTPDELRETGARIRSLFNCDTNMEYAVEIDPRSLTREHVKALAETGCNRASIGVQDVNEQVQKSINRIQPMSVNRKTVEWLKSAGIVSLNIDLIYGLPYQSRTSFEVTLEAVKSLDPHRFAIFNYAHVPWMMPSQKLLDRFPMPDIHEKYSMLQMITNNLMHSGYCYIGMDHFAKEDDELAIAGQNGTLQRNFQGYSTLANTDIYGIGMSAISQIGDRYLQSFKDLDAYYKRIDNGKHPWTRQYILNRDDLIRRSTIMRLMCDLEVNLERISEQWNIPSTEYFAQSLVTLESMADDGLVTSTEKGYRVTETGRLFLRNIATAFDAYFRTSEKKTQYSKTV
ncbi:MAG: oxygen-independent coproporphyrinogen III oxidase [Balneolales bacterium]